MSTNTTALVEKQETALDAEEIALKKEFDDERRIGGHLSSLANLVHTRPKERDIHIKKFADTNNVTIREVGTWLDRFSTERLVRFMRTTSVLPVAEMDIHFPDADRDKEGFAYDVFETEANIETFLNAMRIKLSFNLFSGKVYIDGFHGKSHELSDDIESHIRFGLELFHCRVRPNYLHDAIIHLAQYNFCHPIKDMIESIEWDKTPRVGKFLSQYAGAESNEFVDAVGQLLLMAMIRRVYKPGCKFDTVLVLESPEGWNKSSFLKALAGGDEYFTDSFSFGMDAKEIIEQTQGKWIVEVAEMTQRRSADIQTIKNMLSVTSDRARGAYGRNTSEIPRSFVLVGTTNDTEYLKSHTGNRRFWPVKLTRPADLVKLKADLGQLLAEARVLA
jgi:predicted P-loop ATPase